MLDTLTAFVHIFYYNYEKWDLINISGPTLY